MVSLWVCGCNGGEYALTEWVATKKKIESPPKLGLEAINIASFMEGLIYYQNMCPKFRYGNGKVLGTQPHPTRGSASIYCVLRLNLIKVIFNIYHFRLTHMLASKQST